MLSLNRYSFFPASKERGTEEQRHEESEIIIQDYLNNEQWRIKFMRLDTINHTLVAEWNIKGPRDLNFNRTFNRNNKDQSSWTLNYETPDEIQLFQGYIDPKHSFCKIYFNAPPWVSIQRTNADKDEQKIEKHKKAAEVERAFRNKPIQKSKRLVKFALGK